MHIGETLAMVGSLQFGLSGPLDCHVYALQGSQGLVLIDAGAGTHSQQILSNVASDLPGNPITVRLVPDPATVAPAGGTVVVTLPSEVPPGHRMPGTSPAWDWLRAPVGNFP